MAIVVCRLDGHAAFVNDELAAMFAGAIGAGSSVLDFGPLARAGMPALFARAAAGATVKEEARIELSGRALDLGLTLLPLRGTNGAVESIALCVSDLSRQTHLDLAGSEANLAAAQRIAGLGSWEMELRDLEDVDANPLRWSDEIFRIFGVEPRGIAVTNENFLQAVHPDDRALVRSAVRKALEDGADYRLEHRIVRPDGTQRIVLAQSELQRDPATGRPVRLVGTVMDVTEHKGDDEATRQQRHSLEQSQATWNALIEHAPDQIFGLDADGIIRFLNRAVPPFSNEEILGTHWLDYVPGDQRCRLQEALDRVLKTGAPETYEVMAQGADASMVWYSSHLGPIIQHGRTTGAVLIARDITQRKQTEAQLMVADRLASVGTLAAGVAHEINNPLAALVANVDMARKTVAGGGPDALAVLADILADIHDAAESVRRIVLDLRHISRADEEETGDVDVPSVLESSIRMAWVEIRHRARLVREFAGLPRAIASHGRLGQVFLNLLINAAQSIEDGRAEQNRIVVRGRSDATHVYVDIEDTGCGISGEVRARLFSPFFSTKPPGIGTGLGLSISRRILAGFGAEILVKSCVGAGSTFTVVLKRAPDQRARRDAPPRSPPPATPRQGQRRRGTVLVIDDEPMIGQAIKRALEPEHDAVVVTRGADALELLERGDRYDVVLCDVMMPQVSGMDLYAELMKTKPDIAKRIVFLTGGAFTERARDFIERVPNVRLEKPFEADRLSELVNERVSEQS
jgi:PAS domain S-box-containing protein